MQYYIYTTTVKRNGELTQKVWFKKVKNECKTGKNLFPPGRVPVRLFLNDKGLVKVEVALAKGKHTYDKRQSLKDKDANREMDRHEKY